MASDLDAVRSAIESAVSNTWASRTTVQWHDRPFDQPASGGWLRVTILFGDGFLFTMGDAGTGLNRVVGVVELAVFDRVSEGLGNVVQLGDYARRAVSQLEVSGITFGVPSGPQLVNAAASRDARPELSHLVVSAPFTVIES